LAILISKLVIRPKEKAAACPVGAKIGTGGTAIEIVVDELGLRYAKRRRTEDREANSNNQQGFHLNAPESVQTQICPFRLTTGIQGRNSSQQKH
jgi:hypothetical protein